MAHHAKLAIIGGKPAILATGFWPGMTNPIYTYDGADSLRVAQTGPSISANSVTTGDFLGNGTTQIIYGDLVSGPGVPYDETKAMAQYLYAFDGTSIGSEPIAKLPTPYFNDKPEYAVFKSQFGASKTHNARLWTDDFNQDGKPDVVVGAVLWDGKSLTAEKSVSIAAQ